MFCIFEKVIAVAGISAVNDYFIVRSFNYVRHHLQWLRVSW